MRFRGREIPSFVWVGLGDLLLFLLLLYLANAFYAGTPYYSTIVALVILIALLVPFFYIYQGYRKIKEKERFFPQFLKDLADIYRSGISLVQATYQTSQQNYGALTPHIRKLAIRLSWGIPFEEAFKLFAKETKSPLIEGATLIILEAFASGGDIPSVLETVAEDIRKLKDLEEERKSHFAPFVGTMYVVFLISIGLSYILLQVLLPEIPVLPSFSMNFTPQGGQNFGGTATIPEYPLKILFLHLLLIQAIISGLIAGIIGEGSWSAGLKHVLVMGFIALLSFQLFILPTNPADRIARTLTKMPLTMSFSVDLGQFYVEHNITVADVNRFIVGRRGLFGGGNVRIKFTFAQDPQCKLCGKLVEVNADGVFIKKPVYLSFRVVSNGDGTATVYVR